MEKNQQYVKATKRWKKLLIFHNLAGDDLLDRIIELISEQDPGFKNSSSYLYNIGHRLLEWAVEEGVRGDLLKGYFLWRIILDNNVFSRSAEQYGNQLSLSFKNAVLHDLKVLVELYKKIDLCQVAIGEREGLHFLREFEQPSSKNDNQSFLTNCLDQLKGFFSKGDSEGIYHKLLNYYQLSGAGELGRYRAFHWINQDLVGIKYIDPIRFSDLIGYESQIKRLKKNTEDFIRGEKANNILLFGDSGTGKSSSIKSLLNEYSAQGLRLIEINRNQVKQLPEMLEYLQERGLYFIIYLDDLSFENFETDYKYLKAVIEGGVEVKPDNVLFYATSNRRHLVKESWGDREKGEEVHPTEGIQEKLSLAERFGITITYLSPDKTAYLEIVRGLAKNNGLDLPADLLEEKALQWEVWHNGRSGRTAKQFINYLAGDLNR